MTVPQGVPERGGVMGGGSGLGDDATALLVPGS